MANANPTASVQSPADVVNLSLAMLGYRLRVGSLYDGSLAAKKALDVYAQTRDEALRAKDWPFAQRLIDGVTAAGVTLAGWTYAWEYPDGCLRVRQVFPAIPILDYDPQPVLWTLYNLAGSPGQKVIATQISPIGISYVGQVTDMTLWEPLFVASFVQLLSVKLGPVLRTDMAPMIEPERTTAIAITADEPLAPNNAEIPPTAEPARQPARRRA